MKLPMAITGATPQPKNRRKFLQPKQTDWRNPVVDRRIGGWARRFRRIHRDEETILDPASGTPGWMFWSADRQEAGTIKPAFRPRGRQWRIESRSPGELLP